jgi:hypothetical protein
MVLLTPTIPRIRYTVVEGVAGRAVPLDSSQDGSRNDRREGSI